MNYDSRIEETDLDAGGPKPARLSGLPDENEDDRRRNRRRMAIGAAIVLILIIAIYLKNHQAGDPLGENRASQAPLVSVITAKPRTIAGRISASGTLAARRELPVGVAGEGGQVVQVLVEPGQWVAAGQVLAVIDRSVQVEQQAGLAAQVQVAQADARLAQANLDRALKLVDRGFISKADVDRLTASRDVATARVRVATAQHGEARAKLGRLNIVAPAAGLVLERRVEPGQVVSPASGVLFRLAKGGEFEMLARMSETDLAKLAPGTSASILPVGSSKTFTGQVWQVSPVIDPQTRQGTARIALAYAPELRPGGFASAEIASGTAVASFLPNSAVLSDDKGSYVLVVGKGNKVEKRDVTVGEMLDDGLVIARGLSGDELVVERAGAFLAPGETVRTRLDQAAGR